MNELFEEFKQAVDYYLALCKEHGCSSKSPELPSDFSIKYITTRKMLAVKKAKPASHKTISAKSRAAIKGKPVVKQDKKGSVKIAV